MCGRYYINSNILKKIEQADAFSDASVRAAAQEPRRDIRPSETAPVLGQERKQFRTRPANTY